MPRVTQLVAYGRRLMTPKDKAKAVQNGGNDWPEMATATEVREYGNGRRIKYDRSFFSKPGDYHFTVVALDADTGKYLTHREREKRYEDARHSIERTLGV
jgi:hypothetical protein